MISLKRMKAPSVGSSNRSNTAHHPAEIGEDGPVRGRLLAESDGVGLDQRSLAGFQRRGGGGGRRGPNRVRRRPAATAQKRHAWRGDQHADPHELSVRPKFKQTHHRAPDGHPHIFRIGGDARLGQELRRGAGDGVDAADRETRPIAAGDGGGRRVAQMGGARLGQRRLRPSRAGLESGRGPATLQSGRLSIRSRAVRSEDLRDILRGPDPPDLPPPSARAIGRLSRDVNLCQHRVVLADQ